MWTFFAYNDLIIELHNLKSLISFNIDDIENYIEGDQYIFSLKIPSLHIYYSSSFGKLSKIKLPLRKKYKDLDKQAEFFIEQEKKNFKDFLINSSIKEGDIIKYSLAVIDTETKEPLCDIPHSFFWSLITKEDIDFELKKTFVGKKKGDSFESQASFFKHIMNVNVFALYTFKITIIEHVSDSYFDVSIFQKYFNLKSHKDVCNKLIEVFSFKNDISLRREISQMVLNHIKKQCTFSYSNYFTEQKKRDLLEVVSSNSDYLLFQAEKDFKKNIEKLAKKEIEELICIDSYILDENLQIERDDLLLYMNLLQRKRLKDFIYFQIPLFIQDKKSIPIPDALLKIIVLREKAINNLIKLLGD